MRIGIDISQICYEGTGVATYTKELIESLLRQHSQHSFVLFGSSLRQKKYLIEYGRSLQKKYSKVELNIFPLPPLALDFLWNRFHICPIEWFIGEVDIFWSSDWTQPPLLRAKGITTIHDLIIYKYPEETHKKQEFSLKTFILKTNIVETQKRRLQHVVRECQAIVCDSESTKQDVQQLLQINNSQLFVVYPGYNGR